VSSARESTVREKRGRKPLSLSVHLGELKKRHQTLSDRIEEYEKDSAFDQLAVSELKRHKLLMKGRITRIENTLANDAEKELSDAHQLEAPQSGMEATGGFQKLPAETFGHFPKVPEFLQSSKG